MSDFDSSQFRAILLDVDRTLTNSKGEVTEATHKALEQAQQRGWVIGMATGRGVAECLDLFAHFSPDRLHVLCAGAQLVRGTGEIVWEESMESDLVRDLCQRALEEGADFGFPQGELYFASPAKTERKRVKGVPLGEVSSLKSWRTPLLTLDTPSPELISHVYSLPGLVVKEMVANNGRPYIDISLDNFSKATGAERWAKEYGLSLDQVIAVGDGNNDLEILEAAGWGVAMANAAYNVKEAADQVIGNCDEDGLAKWLKGLPHAN